MKAADRSSSGDNGARWLVLGAAGFLGRATIAELVARGRRLVGTDRTPRPADAAAVGAALLPLDALDAESVRIMLRRWQPDVLLNAVGHDPATLSDPGEFYADSATTVLEAVLAERPSCRVVLLGSAAEYGNAPDGSRSRESDPLVPLTPYGRAKREQFEVSCRFAAKGLAVTTGRVFNTIGAGQGSHLLVGALLERSRRGESPLRVICANHVRDWIDVRDVATALVALAEAAHPPRVANICTGAGHTVASIATQVARLVGVDVVLEPAEVSPTVLGRSVGDPSRVLGLGWRPRRTLAGSLRDQWAHFSLSHGAEARA